MFSRLVHRICQLKFGRKMSDLPSGAVNFRSQDDNTWILTVAEYQQMDKSGSVNLKPDCLITLLVEIRASDIIVFCEFSNLDILYADNF